MQADARPGLRLPASAAAVLLLSWFALCVYSYSRSGQFFMLDPFLLPSWLENFDRLPRLLGYAGRFSLLALAAVSAFAAGAGLLRLIKAGPLLDAATWAVFSCAAGLGMFSYATLAMGAAGLLSAPALFALVAAPLALVYPLRREIAARMAEPDPLGRAVLGSGPLYVALSLLLLFSAATALIGSLSPEIFYDALFYHLGVPNHYVQEGRVAAVPWNLSSSFPYLIHMLYTLALGLSYEGGVLAKLFHYLTGLLLMVSMPALARKLGFSVRAGLLAAAIFFSTPMVILNWSVAGVELGSALYTFLAAGALAIFAGSSPGNRRGALLLAAIFSGLACSTKYPAFFVGVAGLAVIFFFREKPGTGAGGSSFPREAAVYCAINLALVSPWLIRNAAVFGNPLYPFLGGVFGGEIPDPDKWLIFLSDGMSRNLPAVLGSAERLWEMLAHPWRTTMSGGMGNADFLGVLYLALLPAPLLVRMGGKNEAPLKVLALFFLVMWASWAATTTMPRYFIPSLAVLSALIAASLERALLTRAARVLLLPAAGAIMFMGIQWAGAHLRSQEGWRQVFGFITESEYLGTQRPTYPAPYYRAMEYINASLPEDSRILFAGDARSFYCRRRHMAPSVHDVHPLVRWARDSSDAGELHRRIREAGITHIFLNLSETVRLHESYKIFQWDDRSAAVFRKWWPAHVRAVWDHDSRREGGSLLLIYEIAENSSPGAAGPDFISGLDELMRPRKGAGQ